MINLAGPSLQPTAFPLNCNSSAAFTPAPPSPPPKKIIHSTDTGGNKAGGDLFKSVWHAFEREGEGN